ncbi:hypothetical protein CYLTODRAFT_255418 [Cylindrobasidium torrendii FP15055 ss-10]|uniref:Uncharacterized protein n=1 Tax=Cylindrobasidium torrendii FP15055 ss-10 TaxID=1314674 RepID=A0A0D7BUA1_9AGAR|nr:hypothetical protein CYLTODRAFT_255418 [Cylindrobasidium torrendii FP15055 ss-10]
MSSTSSEASFRPSPSLRKSYSHPSFPPPDHSRRVTPALLRSIFASFRTPWEERVMSRVAFFRFSAWVLSCVFISWTARKH